MRQKTRLLTLLVLLMTAATGAWAQTETLLTTITASVEEEVSYSTANVATVSFSTTAQGQISYTADWGWRGYGWSATVTAAEGYTITKCVFYDDQNRTATDSEAPFVVETTEQDRTPRVNGTPIDGGNTPSKGVKKIEVYGYAGTPAPTPYTVSLKDGTEDAANWTGKAGKGDYQALPLTDVAKGAALTLKYAGTKKVKSVKAVKKAEAPSLVIEDKNNYFGIGNQKFYFTEGETWTEAMANHPENAAAGWVIYNDRLRFKPDVYGYAIFILRSGDYYIIEDTILNQPIDTSKTYMFEGTTPT